MLRDVKAYYCDVKSCYCVVEEEEEFCKLVPGVPGWVHLMQDVTCRSEISDSISETGRRKSRQVAHHLGNAKRSFSPNSSRASDSDSEEDELRPGASSSQTPDAEQLNSQHESAHAGSHWAQQAKEQPGPLQDRHVNRRHSQKQQAYSSEEDDGW